MKEFLTKGTKPYADSVTLKGRDIKELSRILVTVSGKTITLPTPVKSLKNQRFDVVNDSDGSITIACSNGFAQSGDSVTLASGATITITCMYGASGWIWTISNLSVVSSMAASALTTDEVEGIQASTTPITGTNAAVSTDDMTAAIAAAASDADGLTADEVEGIQSAVSALTATNYVMTKNDVPLASPAAMGTLIASADAKTTPVDADKLCISDSADSNIMKRSTIAQVRTTLLSADALGTVIAGLAAKASPIDADSIAVCDSADTNDAKEVTLAQLRTALLAADPLGSVIAGLDAKATPIDADSIVVCDSADTNNAKETTIAQLKAVVLSADNVGSAIAGYSAKASPVDADSIVLCDSADTNDAKEVTVAQLRTALLAADPLGTVVNGLSGKATPVDADMFVLADSADTNDAKKVTWAQLKTTLGLTSITTFSPTLAWTGGAPTVTAEVYRQKTSYDWCDWRIDIAGSDGANCTTLTLDFDAARVPADVNMKVPVKAQVSVNAGAFTNVLATLDCEAAAGGDRHLVVSTGTLTTGQAFRIIISGGHEITPA